MPKRLYLVRHGETDANLFKIIDAWNAPHHKPRIICMNDISHLKEGHY